MGNTVPSVVWGFRLGLDQVRLSLLYTCSLSMLYEHNMTDCVFRAGKPISSPLHFNDLTHSMEALTQHLANGQSLNSSQVSEAATGLLDEALDANQKAAFLKALSAKGETPEEIAAFVNSFLEFAVRPPVEISSLPGPAIDVCGTGGDKLNLFNVSTTAMFVLAAGGTVVVKHGNRGITSKCGGADVLEALNVRIDLPPDQFAETIINERVGFMLAPQYHPAFKAVVPVRKMLAEEGVRTIFNLIGPLLNPVQPDYQLVGVFDEALPPVYADILQRLGRKTAWAVHGKTDDGRGMDEISTLAETHICETNKGSITQSVIDPSALGFPSDVSVTELQSGSAVENAAILEGVLSGAVEGPKREITLLNAAAGFVVTGLCDSLENGLSHAREVLQSGAALDRLRALQAIS